MASGYTRQSAASIAPNQVITSAAFNNEYNQLVLAFDATQGHVHDGTTGNSQPIGPVGLNGVGLANGAVIASTMGTFSTTPLGTSANNIVQLDNTGKLPAVDGSQLTGIGSVVTDATNVVFGWQTFQ